MDNHPEILKPRGKNFEKFEEKILKTLRKRSCIGILENFQKITRNSVKIKIKFWEKFNNILKEIRRNTKKILRQYFIFNSGEILDKTPEEFEKIYV